MPTRAELKKSAKLSMKGRKPGAALVTLVYFIIILVLSGLSIKLQFPGLTFVEILEAMSDPELLPPQMSTFANLLDTAIGIMTTIIGVGLTIYCLKVSRDEEAGFGELFDAFGMFFKFLFLSILISLFTTLWTLLLIIPGIIASYRYRMAYYIQIDNPEFSTMECIRRSKEMMDGHKWELFVLDLSFIGWALLCVIPFVALYVIPYMQITEAKYYNALSGYVRGADSTAEYGSGPDNNHDRDPWD